MKKFGSLFLTAALTFSLGTSAFADVELGSVSSGEEDVVMTTYYVSDGTFKTVVDGAGDEVTLIAFNRDDLLDGDGNISTGSITALDQKQDDGSGVTFEYKMRYGLGTNYTIRVGGYNLEEALSLKVAPLSSEEPGEMLEPLVDLVEDSVTLSGKVQNFYGNVSVGIKLNDYYFPAYDTNFDDETDGSFDAFILKSGTFIVELNNISKSNLTPGTYRAVAYCRIGNTVTETGNATTFVIPEPEAE